MALSILLLSAGRLSAQCSGDCDGDRNVAVGELIVGVNVALGQRPLDDCTAFDSNGNGRVDINELLAAVRVALDTCPTPVATATPTDTATPTPTDTATPSPTPNLPPQVEPLPIYRTYPGFDVALPLPVNDPEGAALACEVSSMPDGSSYDSESNSLLWNPTDDQIGPAYASYSCADDATPPQTAEGDIAFQVAPLDACTTPNCDPATGCAPTLIETETACCSGPPEQRVVEPDADCPDGRVLYIGRNQRIGFGRLHNCDLLRMSVLAQAGARLLFNVETRCLSTATPMSMHARMESASRKPVFEVTTAPIFFFRPRSDGFDQRLSIQVPIPGGPYFDLEDSEANFTVTMTDGNGDSASHTVRVILTSDDVPDLPEDEFP